MKPKIRYPELRYDAPVLIRPQGFPRINSPRPAHI
jgi:hypothetical protein